MSKVEMVRDVAICHVEARQKIEWFMEINLLAFNNMFPSTLWIYGTKQNWLVVSTPLKNISQLG